jgi:ribonuclease BN (tRNA processing enzyme)
MHVINFKKYNKKIIQFKYLKRFYIKKVKKVSEPDKVYIRNKGADRIFLYSVGLSSWTDKSQTMLFVDGDTLLMNCCDGTFREVIKSPRSYGKVSKIFISHLHPETVFGLPNLITGLLDPTNNSSVSKELKLFGPVGLRTYLEGALYRTHTKLLSNVIIQEFSFDKRMNDTIFVRDKPVVVEENTAYKIEIASLHDKKEQFCFIFSEKDVPGTINAEALSKAGIPRGPIYSKIKYEDYTPPGLNRSDIITGDIKGRKIVFIYNINSAHPTNIIPINDCSVLVEGVSVSETIQNNNLTNSTILRLATQIKSKNLLLQNPLKNIDKHPDDFSGKTIISKDTLYLELIKKTGKLKRVKP